MSDSVSPGSSTTRVRLDSLTGLRIFAALMVFVFHVVLVQDAGGAAKRLTFAGTTGVSFFFILSGFVLAWSSREGDTARAFFRRRAARILPVYWVTALIGLAFAFMQLDGQNDAVKQMPSFLLVQSWFPEATIYQAGNVPGWSLSAEAFFYLLFPLIVPYLRRLGDRGVIAALIAGIAMVIAIPLILHPMQSSGLSYWATYILPATRVFEFIVGICVALMVKSGFRVPINFVWASVVAVAAIFVANWMPYFLTFAATTVVPFALLIAAAAQSDLGGRKSLAGWKPVVRLGEWSYAFYLVHFLVLRVMLVINESLGFPWWLLGVAALIVSVAASAVLCEYIEKPLERRLRSDHKLPAVLTV